MIQLYTGEGKGKTTAAIGLAMRAAGNGIPVFFAQFMKGNDTGELHSLKAVPQIHILRSEKNFGFFSRMSEEDKAELTAIHNRILETLLQEAEKEQQQGNSCVCILDEITYPVNWGLLGVKKLKALLQCTGEKDGAFTEIVLTGRSPAEWLEEQADYITRMEAVRHPYEKGVRARKGIEF